MRNPPKSALRNSEKRVSSEWVNALARTSKLELSKHYCWKLQQYPSLQRTSYVHCRLPSARVIRSKSDETHRYEKNELRRGVAPPGPSGLGSRRSCARGNQGARLSAPSSRATRAPAPGDPWGRERNLSRPRTCRSTECGVVRA